MAELPPIVLADFPIVAPHVADDPDDAEHTVRSSSICRAVNAALKLPAGVVMSSDADYASLGLASVSKTDPVTYRIRINGLDFGKGSKKLKEYVSVSVVCIGPAGEITGFTEDVRKLGGTSKGWADFHAGKYPGLTSPPPTKGDPKEFGRLSFADANDEVLPITPALRKLVAAAIGGKVAEATAKVVKVAKPKSVAKKAEKKPAKVVKKPAKVAVKPVKAAAKSKPSRKT